MSSDPTLASMARLLRPKTLRVDRETGTLSWSPPRHWDRLAPGGAGRVLRAGRRDRPGPGPGEARLGLAAGERPGPLGQVVGYWAPDLWPGAGAAEFLARAARAGRPAQLGGRSLAGRPGGHPRRLDLCAENGARHRARGAGLLLGICWFGSIALIDRSGALGLDLIVGLATLAALDRLMTAGAGWVAGLWASLAFLSGGLPPLVVIALAIVVMGRKTPGLRFRSSSHRSLTVILWSAWTCALVSPELCASALALPFTQKPAWLLGLGVARPRAAL